ncbi:MAG: LysR family transcriptional regulator [Leucothrix sp.]
MDKLGDMDLFVRVVKNAGLAAAGREVGLSPASMSARINALEERYGTRLLNRSTRHVSATETGQQFYEACLGILADVNEVESQIFTGQETLSGTLRITASSDMGQLHIAKVLSQFVEKHPDLVPYLNLSDGIVNIIEEGFDLAIRYGDLPDSSLVARKLASNHRVLCASPEYLESKGTPSTLQELSEHDCLVMTRGTEPLTNWYFQTDKGVETIPIKPSRSSNDGALIRRWAMEGAGIALKSYLEVAGDIKAGRLNVVLEDYEPDFSKSGAAKKQFERSSATDLHVIYPSRQYVPKRVQAFIEDLQEYFRELGL